VVVISRKATKKAKDAKAVILTKEVSDDVVKKKMM
jgi:hypothetical protein